MSKTIKTEKNDLKSLEELTKQLELCQAQAQENLNGWQRAKADYANLKREMESQREDLITYANLKLIEKLLPVHLNFTTALKHIPAEQQDLDWVVGLKHIKSQLDEFLKSLNVTEIETEGQFDPRYHEALSQEQRADLEDGQIISTFEGGYRLKDRVIKPARVIVNVKP